MLDGSTSLRHTTCLLCDEVKLSDKFESTLPRLRLAISAYEMLALNTGQVKHIEADHKFSIGRVHLSYLLVTVASPLSKSLSSRPPSSKTGKRDSGEPNSAYSRSRKFMSRHFPLPPTIPPVPRTCSQRRSITQYG
nr:hypothetical protein CFP56_63540 [Quercus suber]